jgi:ATP/maltotriose-dependent transcriptional regulator MalT
VQTMRSQYAPAWTAGRKLLPAVIRSGNLSDCLVGCYLLAIAALHLGRWGDALEVAGEGAAIAERTGATMSSVSMHLLEAWIALEGQRFEEARRLSLADRSLAERPGCKVPLQMSLLFGGAAALGMGELGAADADLERLRAWYAGERAVLDWLWKPQLHSCLAQLAIRNGDLDRAWAESQAAQLAADRTPERTWRARAQVVGAQVAIERGEFEEAERLLRQARRETRGIEAPLASCQIEAVMATLLDKTSQPDSARRARTRYERTFHRLERSIHEHQLEPLSQAAGRFH